LHLNSDFVPDIAPAQYDQFVMGETHHKSGEMAQSYPPPRG